MSAFATGRSTYQLQQRTGVFARSTVTCRASKAMLLSKVASTALLPATVVTRYSVARCPPRPSTCQGCGGAPGVKNRPTQAGSDALKGAEIKTARIAPRSIGLTALRTAWAHPG